MAAVLPVGKVCPKAGTYSERHSTVFVERSAPCSTGLCESSRHHGKPGTNMSRTASCLSIFNGKQCLIKASSFWRVITGNLLQAASFAGHAKYHSSFAEFF